MMSARDGEVETLRGVNGYEEKMMRTVKEQREGKIDVEMWIMWRKCRDWQKPRLVSEKYDDGRRELMKSKFFSALLLDG